LATMWESSAAPALFYSNPGYESNPGFFMPEILLKTIQDSFTRVSASPICSFGRATDGFSRLFFARYLVQFVHRVGAADFEDFVVGFNIEEARLDDHSGIFVVRQIHKLKFKIVSAFFNSL